MIQSLRSGNFRPVTPLPCLPQDLFALGRIAAGIPLEAIEDRQRSELLAMLTAPGRYALQVGDDSMCEAGILAGDIVVIQSQQQAANGDIVVALLDGEQVILKRIRYLARKRIQLLADNSADKDQVLDDSRIFIQGRVIGQIRSYR
jgi:repressor LexA